VLPVPRLAAGVGDQLELHAPRREEVDPAVALGRALARGRLTEDPDAALAQVEGGIVFGLSAALVGEITITKGAVVEKNFRDYQMIRLADAPRVTAAFIRSDAPLGGLGEPCVPPIAPAVANAIHAATGVRVRELPIRKASLVKRT
jgi:CO/xanthine dehydrogenase Mo-binding subunit